MNPVLHLRRLADGLVYKVYHCSYADPVVLLYHNARPSSRNSSNVTTLQAVTLIIVDHSPVHCCLSPVCLDSYQHPYDLPAAIRMKLVHNYMQCIVRNTAARAPWEWLHD